MNLGTIPLLLLAPLPFWILGLPWLIRGEGTRVRLAPLIGCALAGFYAELALIAGLPVLPTIAVLVAASAAVVLFLGRGLIAPVTSAVREWIPLYLLAVLAASISPFPVLGNWDGDWLLLYQMGQAVIHSALRSDMLARPPLFGAAAAPLWLIGDGLIPYQLMSAVASASAITALLRFVHHFWPRAPRLLLLPLLLSPFFLHHTAAAWAKMLAAGLVLSAVREGVAGRRLASAALLALAVGVHEGAIIWMPCVLVANVKGPWRFRSVVSAVWPLVVLGILVVAPIQVWTLAKFGLAAKVAASPVMQEGHTQNFFLKTLLIVITTFVGWGPVTSVARWLGNPHPASSVVVAKEAFWLVTSWITTMSGTLLGVLFPFLLTRRSLPRSMSLRASVTPAMAISVAAAVVLNALLSPFNSSEGTMQNGLVPLALAAYGLLAGRLSVAAADGGTALLKRMSLLMLFLGTLPWLLLNTVTSVGLWLSAAFRMRMRTGSEGDYFRMMDNGLQSLGMNGFPQVPGLCLVLLAGWVWVHRSAPQVSATVSEVIAPRSA